MVFGKKGVQFLGILVLTYKEDSDTKFRHQQNIVYTILRPVTSFCVNYSMVR